MRFLVTTTDGARGWRLTPRQLEEWLAERDGAVARAVGDSPYAAADFSYPVADGERLEGSLDADGDALWLQGTVELVHVGAFVAWLRQRLPDELPLLFADEGLRGAVVVEPGTDARTLIDRHIAAALAEGPGGGLGT